jgi:Flp pilus assembly pilin Flp
MAITAGSIPAAGRPDKKRNEREPDMKSGIGEQPLADDHRFRPRRDRGASSVEYAILGSLIAAAIALLVMNLGNQVRLLFDAVTRGW